MDPYLCFGRDLTWTTWTTWFANCQPISQYTGKDQNQTTQQKYADADTAMDA